MFTITVNDHITLHLLREQHGKTIYQLLRDNKDHILQHLSYTLDDEARYKTLCLNAKKQFVDNGDHLFLITYQGQPAGMIELHRRTGGTVSGYEMSYWLGQSFTGKGIITQSARTLTDYVFAHLDENRVFMGISPDNPKSYAVAERLGFMLEGTIRQNDKINGEWVDHQIYAMVKQDWEIPQNPPILCYRLDDRLDLRLVEKRHAQTIFDACDANREHIGVFLPWIDNTNTIDDTMGFIQESLKQYGDNDGWQAGIWHDNQFVGMIGYLFWNRLNQHTEIGYWLAESATGHGIMTRCARELTRYAFETIGLNRAVIRCAVDNKKSAAVAERLGYTHERIERQGIKLRDTFTDVHVYSLLAKEWQTQ